MNENDSMNNPSNKEQIKDLNLDWDNPEKINKQYVEKVLSYLDEMVEEHYPTLSKRTVRKIVFLCKNYDFIFNGIKSVLMPTLRNIDAMATYIIESYYQSIIEEKEYAFPVYGSEKYDFFHPHFGTAKDWFNFIDGLMVLHEEGILAFDFNLSINLLNKKTAYKNSINSFPDTYYVKKKKDKK